MRILTSFSPLAFAAEAVMGSKWCVLCVKAEEEVEPVERLGRRSVFV